MAFGPSSHLRATDFWRSDHWCDAHVHQLCGLKSYLPSIPYLSNDLAWCDDLDVPLLHDASAFDVHRLHFRWQWTSGLALQLLHVSFLDAWRPVNIKPMKIRPDNGTRCAAIYMKQKKIEIQNNLNWMRILTIIILRSACIMPTAHARSSVVICRISYHKFYVYSGQTKPIEYLYTWTVSIIHLVPRMHGLWL